MSQPTDTGPSIEATDLTLRYGDVTALDGLSFRLEGGKIHGLLGRNGSGKTSLLSVVASFRKATAGGIRVDGQPVFEDPAVTRQVCLIRGSATAGREGPPAPARRGARGHHARQRRRRREAVPLGLTPAAIRSWTIAALSRAAPVCGATGWRR